MNEVVIDWIGGNCPVQAEGVIAGKAFYFRARGNRWSLEISNSARMSDVDWTVDWYHEETYGDKPYAAGWMSEEEARAFIHSAAERYFKGD